eukprot:g8023.t1
MVIRWIRGTKRNRRGQTQFKSPIKIPGNAFDAILNINESIELDVTLYSLSYRTLKTGPYGRKDLTLMIQEVENDASYGEVLSSVTIRLNEFVGLMNHELKLPLECDNTRVAAVGRPHLQMNLTSMQKKTSSGITLTNWMQKWSSSRGEMESQLILNPVRRVNDDESNTIGRKKYKNSVYGDGVQKDVVLSNERVGEVNVIVTENDDSIIQLLDDDDASNSSQNGSKNAAQNSNTKWRDTERQISINNEFFKVKLMHEPNGIVGRLSLEDSSRRSVNRSDSIQCQKDSVTNNNSIQQLNAAKNQSETKRKPVDGTGAVSSWLQWFFCLSGSRLICCQSTIPSEPYSFQLHSLSPWPANNGKAIAVAWQRGSKKKKRGVTEAHVPTQVQGQLGTIIHLNEVIQLSATLYMDGNIEPSPTGPFKKKCLILAVIENGVHGRDTSALGRVVIDLSEFASLENEVNKEFPVACSRNVLAAVGDPLLSMTIRCAWKSSGGPASMASSMSSDRTGGTFNTNFSAFVRGSENERIPIPLTGEQFEDLRGFDRLKTITEADDQASLEAIGGNPLATNSRRRLSTYDSEGILHDEEIIPDNNNHNDNSPLNPLDQEQELSSDQDIKENVDIEKLRDEFCFMGSETSLDNHLEGGQAAVTAVSSAIAKDRTSSWLAELSLKPDDPQSPTLGLIHETTNHQTQNHSSEVHEDDGHTNENQKQSHTSENQEEGRISENQEEERVSEVHEDSHTSEKCEEVDHTSNSTLDLIVESVSEVSEVDLVDDKRISIEKKFNTQFQHHDVDDQSKDEFHRQSKIQMDQNKSKAFERRWKRATNPREDVITYQQMKPNSQSQSMSYQSQLHLEAKASDHESVLHKRTFPVHRDAPQSTHTSSLMSELQTVTFMEYAIYLARPSPHKYTSFNVHAPARRIMRGLIHNGVTTNESLNLLQNCLQAIKIMIDGCSMDVAGMAFWWSNCFQLRLLLTNHFNAIYATTTTTPTSWSTSSIEISQNSVIGSINENHQWEFRRMLQNVLKLEKAIFDRLQQYLWWKVMIPLILKMMPGTPYAKLSPSSLSNHHQYNENGVQVWLNALRRVYEEFLIRPSKSSGDQGHLILLRHKLIFNCCRLMDSMLFKELLSNAFHLDGDEGESSLLTNPWDSFRDDSCLVSQSFSWPKLSPAVLPFKKGPLNFGVGMHLKMAVTQWSEWILLESNFKTLIKTGDPGQSFFPLLKASADVLMMPKELLTDSTVRGELFSALSLKSLCILLEKFQPDEFAPDPVDPEVLRSLTERLQDSPDSVSGSMANPKLLEPPFEASIVDSDEGYYDLDGTGGGDHHSFDSESEIALEALTKAFPSADSGVSRFEILKNQWRQTVKR